MGDFFARYGIFIVFLVLMVVAVIFMMVKNRSAKKGSSGEEAESQPVAATSSAAARKANVCPFSEEELAAMEREMKQIYDSIPKKVDLCGVPGFTKESLWFPKYIVRYCKMEPTKGIQSFRRSMWAVGSGTLAGKGAEFRLSAAVYAESGSSLLRKMERHIGKISGWSDSKEAADYAREHELFG